MPDLSMFDLVEADVDDKKNRPDWPEFEGSNSGNAIWMYEHVIERRDAIIKDLSNGIDLKGKAKKVIQSQIAVSLGKNADYLNRREFPNLVQFIQETNQQLARMKPTGGSNITQRSSTKSELNQRIKELETILHTRNVEELINNKVLSQIGATQQERIRLRNENEDLRDELRDLRRKYNSAIDEITELATEIQTLKAQFRKLGGTPANTPNLRPIK